MGKKLSEIDMALYRHTDEILHFIWDPIGISGMVMAREEYHRYLPAVFRLVKQGASATEIEQHLNEIACQHMGITDAESNAARAAELLVQWRSSTYEPNPTFQRTASPPLN